MVTMYKAFVRLYLDYGDIIYSQAYNKLFHQKLQRIQYNACLAITGAIMALRKRNFKQLGLESLENRLWFRKLYSFSKFSETNYQVIYIAQFPRAFYCIVVYIKIVM